MGLRRRVLLRLRRPVVLPVVVFAAVVLPVVVLSTVAVVAVPVFVARVPDSLAVADSLNELGEVAREQGEMAAARDHLERALALGEKVAPESLTVATSVVRPSTCQSSLRSR